MKGELTVERNLRKTRTGKVVSNKMDQTIVVAIEDHVKHPVTVSYTHLDVYKRQVHSVPRILGCSRMNARAFRCRS